MARPTVPASTNGSGLQRLLELEAALAQQLAAVRREGEQLLLEARQRAAAITASVHQREAEAERQLSSRLRAEHARERAALEEEMTHAAARDATLPADRVDLIARQLLDRLLEHRT